MHLKDSLAHLQYRSCSKVSHNADVLHARRDTIQCSKFEVFDNIYVSFKFRLKTLSLILHKYNNSFIGVFEKYFCKLLLRNMVICGSTCIVSWNNFCTGNVPDLSFLVWPRETSVLFKFLNHKANLLYWQSLKLLRSVSCWPFSSDRFTFELNPVRLVQD